jgi:hypothetical protein
MNAIATAATSTLSNLVALLDETVALVANKGELAERWAQSQTCDDTYIIRRGPGLYLSLLIEVSAISCNQFQPFQIRAHVWGYTTINGALALSEKTEFIGTDPATVAAAVPSLIKEIESRFAPVKPARRRR